MSGPKFARRSILSEGMKPQDEWVPLGSNVITGHNISGPSLTADPRAVPIIAVSSGEQVFSKLRKGNNWVDLRSCCKTPQLARYGVIKRFKILIYAHANCAFSPLYVLSRTHLRDFTTAS